jgi:adenosylcobinamide hydrolase
LKNIQQNGGFLPNGPDGERIERDDDTLVIRFPGKRNCLSTSWLNGGYRGDLTAVFNHRIPPAACESCHLPGGDVRSYLAAVAGKCSLDPIRSAGLLTKADMRNTAFAEESFRDLTVQAIVTGGIDVNGGRAGDPASYYEMNGQFEPVGGTINTILLIKAALPEYAMARAIMTATEAKAAALQQIMGRSMYSTGIATGSGTDMIAVVSNPCSNLHLSDAGKHSKLGELIGRSVIRATLAALEKETGLSAESQRDVLVRLSRFRLTEEDLLKAATQKIDRDSYDPETKEQFLHYLNRWAKDPGAVALIAAALHIVDEAEWGLIPQKEAGETIICILRDNTSEVTADSDEKSPLHCLTGALALLAYQKSCTDPGWTVHEEQDEQS